MRVVQLIDSLEIGGGERMSVNLANFFSEKEIPNLLVATRKGGALQALVKNQKSLLIFSKRSALDFITFYKILRNLKPFVPTIFHAHDSSIFWAVLLKFFFPRAMVVWHAHYGGFSSQDARFGKKIKYLERFIDRVIVVNRDLLAWVNSGLSRIPKAAYIGNFPNRISGENVTRSNSKWIISVANLKHPKDHQTLILAFSKFLKANPGFQLALIGSHEDPAYLSRVVELIQKENLENSIQLTGPVIHLKEWFEKARIAVLSSTVEGLPVSLLELGLSGVPVISSEVGACLDLLEKGTCGFLVPSKSVEALADALDYAINNPQEASKRSELFYQKITREFGGDNFFRQYSALIYSQ